MNVLHSFITTAIVGFLTGTILAPFGWPLYVYAIVGGIVGFVTMWVVYDPSKD